jgi:hypothetical protein
MAQGKYPNLPPYFVPFEKKQESFKFGLIGIFNTPRD